MQARTRSTLAEFALTENLPADFPALAERWFEPLAQCLLTNWQRGSRPLLVGVNGAQGTGKTTLCSVLELLLGEQGVRAVTLSLDDFYLPREERRKLAQRVHPLLRTRGVPGTHEPGLLEDVIDELLAGSSCTAPRFDKSVDDRYPQDQWKRLDACDLVLFEGWCVGCPPQSGAALQDPVNRLEAEEDSMGVWRRYVNAQLSGDYAGLFARLDYLVVLQAPSLAVVLEWRSLQERKLARARPGAGVMDDAELRRFVQHYERLTGHCLACLPARADYLLQMNTDHSFARARVR
jgi:D-glycerate 3-kinase